MARRGQGHRDLTQELRFACAPDGVRIAYAIRGHGPPLVMAPSWISHLERDWDTPVWRHCLDALGRIATVIRFNERGFGLSDHDVSDFSLEARYGDLSAVIEAAGLDRFALMGMSQSGPIVIRLGGCDQRFGQPPVSDMEDVSSLFTPPHGRECSDRQHQPEA